MFGKRHAVSLLLLLLKARKYRVLNLEHGMNSVSVKPAPGLLCFSSGSAAAQSNVVSTRETSPFIFAYLNLAMQQAIHNPIRHVV